MSLREENAPSPVGSTDGLDHEDGYRLAAEAFGEIAEAFAGEESIESLLRLIAQRACTLVGVSRCSIYLRREHSQLFKGRITYIDGDDPDRAIRQLTAGVEADKFTREIVSTQRPVLVHDARNDPRVVRAAMRDWHVQTILGLPMVFSGEVRGIMFLDNSDVPHTYTPEEQRIGAGFANLAGVAVVNAERAVRLREATDAAADQNHLLRRITVAADMLARRFASDATFIDIADVVAEVTGKPCWIYGGEGNRLAATGMPTAEAQGICTPIDAPARRHAEVVRALEGATTPDPVVVEPLPSAGIDRQFLVAPVVDEVKICGYVVLAEHQGRALNTFDKAIARRVAGLSLSRMSADRRGTEMRRIAAESLALDLVKGQQDPSVVKDRASVLGVDLSQEHAICLLTSAEDVAGPGCSEVVAAFADLGTAMTLFCKTGAGLVAIFPLSPEDPFLDRIEEARRLIGDAARRIFGETPFSAALITASGERGDFAIGFQAARAILDSTSPPGCEPALESKVLTAHEIDLARLLASGEVSPETAQRLAADTLGALFSEPSRGTLLKTLVAYLDASCNIREAADDLGVHHNTVRYRLARIQELTGLLVVTKMRDLLTAQLALTVLEADYETADPADDAVVDEGSGQIAQSA
jgi:sugar diacid utilization regulator